MLKKILIYGLVAGAATIGVQGVALAQGGPPQLFCQLASGEKVPLASGALGGCQGQVVDKAGKGVTALD
jgi:hypothetical protein